jgi:hypothetical protein
MWGSRIKSVKVTNFPASKEPVQFGQALSIHRYSSFQASLCLVADHCMMVEPTFNVANSEPGRFHQQYSALSNENLLLIHPGETGNRSLSTLRHLS